MEGFKSKRLDGFSHVALLFPEANANGRRGQQPSQTTNQNQSVSQWARATALRAWANRIVCYSSLFFFVRVAVPPTRAISPYEVPDVAPKPCITIGALDPEHSLAAIRCSFSSHVNVPRQVYTGATPSWMGAKPWAQAQTSGFMGPAQRKRFDIPTGGSAFPAA